MFYCLATRESHIESICHYYVSVFPTMSTTFSTNDSFFRQTIVELFFYGTRQPHSYLAIERGLSTLFNYIQATTPDDAAPAVSLICQLILYTRNAQRGKGERTLTYAMMYAMYAYSPSIVLRMLTHLVYNTHAQEDHLPTGGWVDARRLAEYVYSRTDGNVAHPIIQHAIYMINNHLYMDKQLATWSDAAYYLSAVSRWIPRETSASEWLFCQLAHDWCARYTPYCLPRVASSEQRAVRKYKRDYRQLVSRLSAMAPPRDKRIQGLGDFVAEARALLRQPDAHQTANLNRRWADAVASRRGIVGNVLPVLDISRGVEGNALLSAIGVVCLLLETTTLDKRVLAIDQTPTWLVVPANATFVETVGLLFDAVKRFGRTIPRIDRGLHVLDSSFVYSGMTRPDIRTLTVVFVLDMNQYIHYGVGELNETIRCAFSGSVPHLVYWNVGEHPNAPAKTCGDSGLPCGDSVLPCGDSVLPYGDSVLPYGDSVLPCGDSVLPCDFDRYGANVVAGDSFACVDGILPKWRFDSDRNKQYVLANTPFEGVVSVLSTIDVSFLDG